MNTELWVTFYQEMDVIGLDIQTQHLRLMLLAHFVNEVFQSLCYPFYEHLSTILGAPHDMVLAGVVDIPIGLVR